MSGDTPYPCRNSIQSPDQPAVRIEQSFVCRELMHLNGSVKRTTSRTLAVARSIRRRKVPKQPESPQVNPPYRVARPQAVHSTSRDRISLPDYPKQCVNTQTDTPHPAQLWPSVQSRDPRNRHGSGSRGASRGSRTARMQGMYAPL